MRLGDKGEELIKHFEELRLEAYPDPGSARYNANGELIPGTGHPWTIGWGHTGSDVYPGLLWTEGQAQAAFLQDTDQFERDVESLVDVEITQDQFDALVSFAYNVGSDIDADDIAEGLGDSTLLKKLNAGDYQGAADEFPKWNRSGGKVLLGLKRRRAAERALFLGEDWREAMAAV